MKNYFTIIKPGIIIGNLLSLVSTFLLYSHGHVNFYKLSYTLISVSLIIAANCILNNIIDIKIDKKMQRTCHRTLPTNKMTVKQAYYYAFVLGIIGFLCLYNFINLYTCLLCFMATFIYTVIYSIYVKRSSPYAVFVGSISGAIIPLISKAAISNKLNFCSFLLFLIFAIWQIPHSYAIFLYRSKDYQKIKLPVCRLINNLFVIKSIIVAGIIFFVCVTSIFFVHNYLSINDLMIFYVIELVWLLYSIYGYKVINHTQWAYNIFILSLIVVIIFDLMISIKYKTYY
ncbi:protoheme IX farnesyltransferase [Buchnera aphidicola (Nipponaphis monzeni)]|uniref:heme o synthase n=1 Tax=Buchnera aphidicola (Nipponaphis monzeni) TaxID=2495405 RepID=A0A455TAK2_9GAMM|nr:protoheme IX farnesyltransferase [Buchnera aphidicola]BBI01356.1 protoheme IX farnesyltransferase [Buchnera aphidicola (Nipponaphis monzeni)]